MNKKKSKRYKIWTYGHNNEKINLGREWRDLGIKYHFCSEMMHHHHSKNFR